MIQQIRHLLNRIIPHRGLLFRVAVLILVSSCLGVVFNLVYPKGLNPFVSPGLDEPIGEFTYIAFEDAREKFKSGDAIFIDARKKEDFLKGHIPGAFNVTISDFAVGRPEILKFLPEDVELLVYCDSDECQTSEQVARLLKASGFKNVKIIKAGWKSWVAQGLPVEKAKDHNDDNQNE